MTDAPPAEPSQREQASAMTPLLQRVARRQMLALFGRNLWVSLLACAGVFLAALLVSRFLGLIPNWFSPLSIIAVPATALVIAVAFVQRPAKRETARLLDRRTQSKELFLSAAMTSETPGEFAPIVSAQAEARAAEIRPAQVVPFIWQRGAVQMAGALALAFAATLFLPQLDPFKKAEQRQKTAREEERLQATKKATAIRAERLAEQRGKESEAVQQALAQLEKTFKEARPREFEANLKQLADDQKDLGEMWRKVSNDQLKNALDKAAQSFGQMDAKKLSEWREELKKGDLSGIKKELSELREEMKKLAEMPDSAEKRAARDELAQRLNQLAEGMKQSVGSPQVNEALSRALEQLDMSKLGQLSKEAMQSAMDSLQLSQQELEQLAQSLKDGKQLEEALKNLQMAKQLAGMGKLDGEACKNCQNPGDYAALFAAKMGGLGAVDSAQNPNGSGMGPGIGNGAKRPENDATETGFKPEKSTSALTGGKMLLEWKTKEVGETGARAEEFRNTVKQVKQGVSEAIQQEQVPPGYHDTIKRYFETLPEAK